MAADSAYSVLGLRKGTTEQEIKAAYVDLVKKFDPERHTDHFMAIESAYERLRDPAKRAIEDILTYNSIGGRFIFTADEQTKNADAQIRLSVSDLERRFAESPNDPHVRTDYATALMQRSFKKVNKRLWAEALEDWQVVLKIDPTHQRAKNNMLFSFITLGYSYAEHGLLEEAIDLWTKASQMNPDNDELLHNLAVACEQAGKKDDTQRYWAETLKRWQARLAADPDDIYTRQCIIEVRRHHGGHTEPNEASHEKSVDEYREILKINPNDFEAQYKIATAAMEVRNWEEAVRMLTGLMKQFPKNIEVLNLLGWAFLNSGHVEQAFQIWNRSLSIDPKNHSTREAIIRARMSMGRAFRGKGMHTQSLVNFKALLRFSPNSPEVYLEVGQTYMVKGDKRSAAQAFAKVLKLEPKNREAKHFLSEMKLRA